MAIPLVCRQWALVGMEFLYSRLILQDFEQLYKLGETFREHPEYRDWCRYVEILWIQDSDTNNEIAFYVRIRLIVPSLSRMQSLAIHSASPTTNGHIVELVRRVGSQLQTLHLGPGVSIDSKGLWPCFWMDPVPELASIVRSLEKYQDPLTRSRALVGPTCPWP